MSEDLTQPKHCLNCGTPLTDIYCPHCGQKDIPRRQSLGELASNFLGSFTSFESKFFTTMRLLVLKPGLLPKDYIEGKRERYYHPARAYVFISFVFFFLFLSLPKSVDFNFELSNNDTTAQSGRGDFASVAQYDSLQNSLPPEKRDSWFTRKLQLREIELQQRYGGSLQESLGQSFFANFPKVFFFLLPIFALLLKLLYIRRDYFYSEHLVFSIYFYNFIFLTGTLAMLLLLIPGINWVRFLFYLMIAVYLLIALRRMYQQKWWKTTLKFVVLIISFAVLLVTGLMVNLLVSFLFL